MSRITLSPNAEGTAIFTVAAPATSTDRTLTLPDATGTILSSADSGLVGIGNSQTWQAVTRTNATVYQNTTGRPIMFSQSAQNSSSTSPITVEMSPDNVTFIQTNLAMAGTFEWTGVCTIVPVSYYYRTTAVGTTITTRELR